MSNPIRHRLGYYLGSNEDRIITRKWIASLPDSALDRIERSRHEFQDNELGRLIEDEWWNRHSEAATEWPTYTDSYLDDKDREIELTFVMFCGLRDEVGSSPPEGPDDLRHHPSRRLSFWQEGKEGERQEDFFIECSCGWREPRSAARKHRVGPDWWWPTVTRWNCKDLLGPHFVLCPRANSLEDPAHAPDDIIKGIEGTEEKVWRVPPAGSRTTDLLFSKCICGSTPYWPDSFQLISVSEPFQLIPVSASESKP